MGMNEPLPRTEANELITETRETLKRLGLSFPDLAKVVDRSPGTVKNWLYGAANLNRKHEGIIRQALNRLQEQRDSGFSLKATALISLIERAAFDQWRSGSEKKAKLLMDASKAIQKHIDEVCALIAHGKGLRK